MKKFLMIVMGLLALANISCFGSLFLKARREYIQQKMQPQSEREQKIHEDIKQLKSEGKTPREIQRIYMLERKTPEAQAKREAIEQVSKKNQTQQEKDHAWDKFVDASRKERKTTEYRIAHPSLAIPTTQPIARLNFFTGKPMPVSSKPVMPASQNSWLTNKVNNFLKWMRIY